LEERGTTLGGDGVCHVSSTFYHQLLFTFNHVFNKDKKKMMNQKTKGRFFTFLSLMPVGQNIAASVFDLAPS